MSGIRWLLAVLRILDNTLGRASVRGLLSLFSVLWRATKKKTSPASGLGDSKTVQVVYPQAAHDGSNNLYPDTESRVVYTSASLVPASLHPYLNSSPAASRSSQDITAHPITQASYSLHSLSVQHLPATLSVQEPPTATFSVQHLPALPPSPNLGLGGYFPSTNSSVVDLHLAGPATESPSQSRRSSVHGYIAVAALPCLNDEHLRIFPVTPENIQRYTRKTTIPDDPTKFQLEPLTIFVTANPPPPGWTTCQHPEGAQYFFHEEKRVFTDANLFDNTSLTFIHENIDKVHDFLRVHNVHLNPGVDLVLDEYVYDDGSKGCQYYFVNHRDRCVFWMDHGDSDLFSVTQEVKGMKSASQIRHELEAQYWLHCEYYPRAFEVTHKIVDELRDTVLHAFGDVVTSQTSTVSWKIDDLKNMITLIDGFSKNVGKHADKKFSGSSCLVARLMYLFARHRVYNFHGEPGARLNVDQSVYPTVEKRTALIKMLSPLLFYAPDFHLVSLHAIYADGLIRHSGWSEFVTRLNNEWHEFTICATVILNANVAFLAIQSVDNGGVTSFTRSPTQISSYLSTLTSIGSIIIGLLLVKHYRDRDRAPAADAANFIFYRTHPTLGLETLAVLYSLPYAMLMWSMVSFLAAFAFMCFRNSNLLTRTLVGVVLAAVATLILWCVYNSWESSAWDWLHDLVPVPSCFSSPADDASSGDQQDDVKSAASVAAESNSEPKPKKRGWTVTVPSWAAITIRKRSYDSERTVTNV
ncbi:hypothetical protein DFH08DRAFT_406908 [Mycena albidolilacea]|uniref:Uncharacterized protein n=1 Tax=Mycena albidolilacea TaxID=1033008 RepID=A0AAD7F147_9AGAR|nr:hypothetical protein DFH08DRAFT_406908 [Mycena albidolilacea]